MPNIVVILADDLGYGDVACYNPQSKVPTPNIDRLARDGMRFTDAHSPCTVCTPTPFRHQQCDATTPLMHAVFAGRANEPFQILDDTIAAVVLRQCGIFENFKGSERPDFPHRSISGQGIYAEVATFADHPTHWLIALRFSGSPLAVDNGHMIRCYPKSRINAEEMQAISDALGKQLFPVGYDPQIMALKPPQG
jgi:hypothetical protein